MFANKKFYLTLLVSLLLASCGNGGGSGVGGSPTNINELASVSCNNYIGNLENEISEGFGTTKENAEATLNKLNKSELCKCTQNFLNSKDNTINHGGLYSYEDSTGSNVLNPNIYNVFEGLKKYSEEELAEKEPLMYALAVGWITTASNRAISQCVSEQFADDALPPLQ